MQNKKNKGLSIIEVLVAIGIMGIVAVGITTLVTNMMKSETSLTLFIKQRIWRHHVGRAAIHTMKEA